MKQILLKVLPLFLCGSLSGMEQQRLNGRLSPISLLGSESSDHEDDDVSQDLQRKVSAQVELEVTLAKMVKDRNSLQAITNWLTQYREGLDQQVKMELAKLNELQQVTMMAAYHASLREAQSDEEGSETD